MKKTNLYKGLIVLTATAGLVMPSTASAFSLRDFFTGQTNSREDQGYVLSSSTTNNEETKKEKNDSTNVDSITDKVNDQTNQDKNDKINEVIVEVVKGDSLSKIAKAHDTTYVRIFNANESIKDPNFINPGQKLRIPESDEELVSRPIPESAKSSSAAKTKLVNPTSKKVVTTNTRKKTQPITTNAPTVASGSVWDQLARCESGGNWSINTGNGYYGGLQFTAATWRGVGGTGLPHQHSREEQIHRAEILLDRSGWGQWPACTKKLGLR